MAEKTAAKSVEVPPKGFDPARHFRKVNGADYLDVKWRIAWFRSENPTGSIQTNCIELTETRAVFRAEVTCDDNRVATGHGSETKDDFGDFIEKAETKAVGRALAMVGYGTQFAIEDDGHRIADAPVDRGNRQANGGPPTMKVNPDRVTFWREQVDLVADGGEKSNVTVGKLKYIAQEARKEFGGLPQELANYIDAAIGDVEARAA